VHHISQEEYEYRMGPESDKRSMMFALGGVLCFKETRMSRKQIGIITWRGERNSRSDPDRTVNEVPGNFV